MTVGNSMPPGNVRNEGSDAEREELESLRHEYS